MAKEGEEIKVEKQFEQKMKEVERERDGGSESLGERKKESRNRDR